MNTVNPRIEGVSALPAQPSDIALTGDRPTGRLHLGHYAGSLRTRLAIQGICSQTILVADMQALTDNARNPAKVGENVLEVVLDYLACGLDPTRSTICLQSGIPELAEIFMLYLNVTTLSRLERNPTIRTEIEARGFEQSIPMGFVAYPVSQAADITAFGATVVPVGADQLPIIETTNDIVGSVNRIGDGAILRPCRALLSKAARLPGIDGTAKASKSLGNAIDLADDADAVRRKVMSMFTDPNHLCVSDPGRVEGNAVIAYLDAFDPDEAAVADLKDSYRAGGLGDVVLKRRLIDVLDALLTPIRDERARLSRDLSYVRGTLTSGTRSARSTARSTLERVRTTFGLESTPAP